MSNKGKPLQEEDRELREQICEKLDEWSLLPGTTHEEDCGFWGTEDGDGLDFCDCSYRREVDAWLKCLPELIAVIHDRDKHRDAVVASDIAWCLGKLRGLGCPAEHLEEKYGLEQSTQAQKEEL